MRTVVHLDADAFFASVEQAADPRLRGKAVAVGGEKRGIIASASYEARRMGIYTPMPTVRARRLCPKLIVLPGDFEKYEQFSRWMFSYAYDFTPEVEISSIDEGYFDLSGNRRPARVIAETIRQAIRQSLKITVSEGIGSNKLVSQIASKLYKPAAFAQVSAGEEGQFLAPLPNLWLPGVGPKTAMLLDSAGLARIGQVAITPVELLEMLLGRMAPLVRQFARGIDDRPVVPATQPAKSYSHQETFAADTTDEQHIEAVLRRMADQLMAKLRQEGKSIRTVTLKVRYNDRDEDQCSESLAEPTALETDLYGRLGWMLRRAWRRRVSLRMVSLKLSNIYDGSFRPELPLEQAAGLHLARQRLAVAIDELRKTHGPRAILRGHDFVLGGGAQGRGALPAGAPRPPPALSRPVQELKSGRAAVCRPIPLHVHSYYSFLDSTLSIDAIVGLARKHGLPAIALTDRHNLHGAVPFAQAAAAAGIKPIIGAEIRFGREPLRLYVQNATGYANLCRLLSQRQDQRHPVNHSNRAMPSLEASEDRPLPGADHPPEPALSPEACEGLIAVGADPRPAPFFPGRFYIEIDSPEALRKRPASGWPAVASMPVHYAEPADRQKYDIVQSIRTLTLLAQRHSQKRAGGELHFQGPEEMRRLFGASPELLDRSVEIADRCDFQFPFGRPQFPPFVPPDGATPREFLRQLVERGLRRRYGTKRPGVEAQAREELEIIAEVGYEEYFLVVWDLLQECRRRGIEWLTRGSAADSLVCYCLEISNVCPIRFDLYFRRFLNKERMRLNKLPDIDVDFAHDRKDAVIDLVFEKYGRMHAAVVGGFSTFHARAAVAEVAKVLGVSEYQVRRFTEHFPYADAGVIEQVLKEGPEFADLPLAEEPYHTALRAAGFFEGFPRYAKMHPCGVVLSRQPMLDLSPTFVSQKGYPTTHFDMDAVEAIGLIKIDILAQGGLAVMRDVRSALQDRGVEVDLERLTSRPAAGEPGTLSHGPMELREGPPASALTAEPWNDPAVWEMIASGGARAVHHIESPAMVSLCRMCNVREIDGLIAIVSVIRPGAANEQKKTKFTRRYQGLEPPEYLDPCLESCLKSTYGLVVYEEHILQICELFAGLPAGRADLLRRALGKRQQAVLDAIRVEFFASAKNRGHSQEKITEVWDLVSSFAGYAFCKAHSTAYGVEAYQSAWLKYYFPAQFMAAVLTNGKGFYDPLVYVLECHRLGIPMLAPWVNDPGPAFSVASPRPGAGGPAIRVPVTRVKGLTSRTTERLLAEFARGPFESVLDFCRRVTPMPEEMEALIRAGAVDGFGKSRSAQFWEWQCARRSFPADAAGQGWLLPVTEVRQPPEVGEPLKHQRLGWEMELLGFPVSGHPLELYDGVAWNTYCPVSELARHRGKEVVTCGLVIEQRVHHQATGEPMKFLTLADWTGMVETELFAATYRSYGLATVRYPVLEIAARVEPYENGRGHSLRVMRAGKPRLKPGGGFTG